MYPAISVIAFSTLSGAGYGLLGLLALLAPAGLLPPDPSFAWLSLGVALGLVSAGLAVSAAHLHHPERAWRAFSQWRSSWLSREGVAAAAAYVPALAFGWLWLFGGSTALSFAVAGLATAALAAFTVYCTANIYASLKPIRQWRHPLVTPIFLLFGLMSGGLWLLALLGFFDSPPAIALASTAAVAALAWAIKWYYWRNIDRTVSASTAGTATGLGGTVRMLDPPHTELNYLLTEMGYRVARKHARKLRRIAVILGAGLPLLLIGFCTLAPRPLVAALLTGAAVFNLAAVALERWLFFSEATHTVTLYYGR